MRVVELKMCDIRMADVKKTLLFFVHVLFTNCLLFHFYYHTFYPSI